MLQGTGSDGKPIEVALCGTEPSPEDPGMIWYHIEAWNAVAQEWENPCAATGRVPDPRALAVGDTWDASGAHHDGAGKLTFACENGVIAKCISGTGRTGPPTTPSPGPQANRRPSGSAAKRNAQGPIRIM